MSTVENIIQLSKTKQLKNRTIEIKANGALVKSDCLKQYVDIKTVEACRNGCPNYGKKWSCPPYSKDFGRIYKKYQNAFVLSMYTDMESYLDIKNKYLAMKAANVTLKTGVEKAARQLEKQLNGYALLSGSCRLCKACNCKSNKPCKHPKEMRYSMEATHLDVNRLSKEVLAHPLLWYSNKTLPEYTSTVSMVLTNMETDISALRSMIQDIFEVIV